MSSVDWSPELAAALARVVPPGDGSHANWDDVVARVGTRRPLRLGRSHPRRHVRLAIVAALLFLLLAGVATATYLIVRGNGSLVFQGSSGSLLIAKPNSPGLTTLAHCVDPSGCAIMDPAWSPDGTQIAFLRARYTGHSIRTILFVAASDGTGTRLLARCGLCGTQYGSRPGWSPDGRWIAFSRDAGHRGQEALWIVAAAGGPPRRLTDCGTCADAQPTWSPDGRLLIFQRLTTKRDASGLFTIRSTGSGLTRIAARGTYPQWSPDGRRIAFDPTPDSIAVADADGSHLRVLLEGPRASGPGAPSWSPDGRKLVFFKTPRQRGHFVAEVWTMKADGTDKRRLYRSGCCVGEWAPPVWSPDGRQIAFSADSAGGTFVMNADGTGLKRRSSSTSSALAWQRLPKGENR